MDIYTRNTPSTNILTKYQSTAFSPLAKEKANQYFVDLKIAQKIVRNIIIRSYKSTDPDLDIILRDDNFTPEDIPKLNLNKVRLKDELSKLQKLTITVPLLQIQKDAYEELISIAPSTAGKKSRKYKSKKYKSRKYK